MSNNLTFSDSDIADFARKRSIIGQEDCETFKKCLSLIEDKSKMNKLIEKYEKWEGYISNLSNEKLCFHSSVFEYIILVLKTIVYFKNKIKNNEINKLEINILTTQLPTSLITSGAPSYNPYFETVKALNSYFRIFQDLINDEDFKDKINVNRHFLCANGKIHFDNRITLIYPRKIFELCYCDKDENGKPICGTTDGKCLDKSNDCRDNREEFLSSVKNAKHYLFSLTKLDPNSNGEKPKNPEIREFVGFKVINKNNNKCKEHEKYEKCYTSNLTDSMTSMFIKIWNKSDLQQENSNFCFLGVDDDFEGFINKLESNRQTKKSLSSIWGLQDNDNKSKF